MRVKLPLLLTPPATRGDCEAIERPCSRVRCEYNLGFVGDRDVVWSTSDSCALDVADRGVDGSAEESLQYTARRVHESLSTIGEIFDVSRERIRQIEQKALRSFIANAGEMGIADEFGLTAEDVARANAELDRMDEEKNGKRNARVAMRREQARRGLLWGADKSSEAATP